MSDTGFERVASVEDLPPGTLLGADLPNGESVCLYNWKGEIGAVQDECTHAEFSLSDGTLHNDGTIECAWHGARFTCRTGAVCRGPATDPLMRYETEVRDGTIFVRRQAQ